MPLPRRLTHARKLLALAAGVVLASGAARWLDSTSAHAQATAALVDLKGAADLRAQFNADQGNPRLILLLSPT